MIKAATVKQKSRHLQQGRQLHQVHQKHSGSTTETVKVHRHEHQGRTPTIVETPVPSQPFLSPHPTFVAIGCGSSFATVWLAVHPLVPSPPPIPGGCRMLGKGHPPPAALPSLPIPQQPGVKRGGRSAATSIPSQQHAPPPPPYCMTCSVHVWRGASKLS